MSQFFRPPSFMVKASMKVRPGRNPQPKDPANEHTRQTQILSKQRQKHVLFPSCLAATAASQKNFAASAHLPSFKQLWASTRCPSHWQPSLPDIYPADQVLVVLHAQTDLLLRKLCPRPPSLSDACPQGKSRHCLCRKNESIYQLRVNPCKLSPVQFQPAVLQVVHPRIAVHCTVCFCLLVLYITALYQYMSVLF